MILVVGGNRFIDYDLFRGAVEINHHLPSKKNSHYFPSQFYHYAQRRD